MMKEEIFKAHCNDEIAIAIREEEEMLDDNKNDGILPESLDDWRFKVPEFILHHPFTAPSSLFSVRLLTYWDRQYSHKITRSLFEDTEMQDSAPDILPDREKVKEPLDKIANEVLVCPSRMKKTGCRT